MAGTTRTPKQDRSERTRARLAEAARELFAERGYRDVQSKHVAERAGVAVGTFYEYYPDKESVLAAVLEAFLRDFRAVPLAASLRAAAGGDAASASRLLDDLEAWSSSYGRLHRELSALSYGTGEAAGLVAAFEDEFRAAVVGALRAEGFPAPEDTGLFLYIAFDAVLDALADMPDPEARERLRSEAARAAASYLAHSRGSGAGAGRPRAAR